MAQTWPVPGAVADLVGSQGGSGYPDDPATFGTTTADDEEFDTDFSAWTVDTDVTAPNVRDVNQAFCPSRARLRYSATSGASFRLYRAATLDLSGNFSVTFDVSGVNDTNDRFVEVLCADSATVAGADGMGAIFYGNTVPRVAMRYYTNIGTSTFTVPAERSLGDLDEPRRLFLHLQRVSGTWSLWYSNDGATWMRVGNTSAGAITVSHIFLRMGAATVTQPGSLTVNWIRWNRFYL
jgi:hypothetical protein